MIALTRKLKGEERQTNDSRRFLMTEKREMTERRKELEQQAKKLYDQYQKNQKAKKGKKK